MEEGAQSPTGKTGVRRPMNAFLIFCKRHRSLVRERNPKLDNRSVTRILGELWATLPLEEKSTYTSLANEYKEAFLKANPDYKWFNPEKNTAPSNRDKPSTRPSNALTSYTGQIPHTDDNGPLSPTQVPVTSHLSTMIMENKTHSGIPFSTSLSASQGAPISAQGFPIFGMATQPCTLNVTQPVTSITPAITTLAMVDGQPIMVSQTPLMVSLPQQQLTPVTMVTTQFQARTINSTVTTLCNLTTKVATGGLVATPASNNTPQIDRNVGLFELAQMCSTEHAKMATSSDRPNLTPSCFNPSTLAFTMATGTAGSTSGAPVGNSQPEDKPRLDSKVLQGQVKEALGFHFGDIDKKKGQIQNPGGVNHVLDYSVKKNKEAEMARNVLRQDAAKYFGGDPGKPPAKPPQVSVGESIQLSKLVLDHVIEAMYSHDSVAKPPSAPPTMSSVAQNPSEAPQDSQSQIQHPTQHPTQPRNKLMLTFGEIQERVIRSAVEQSDFNDLLRIKSNPQVGQSVDAGLCRNKDAGKPSTVTCDANKENKAANKVLSKADVLVENLKESQEGACDAKQNIPIKKRKPRVKESIKIVETSSRETENSNERILEDAPSSDDLDLDTNDPCDLDAGVRKSKRSNRGRRYQELIQLGYLQPARDKGKRGDDNTPAVNTTSHPLTGETDNSSNSYDFERINQRAQFQEIPQDGVTSIPTKIESEAVREAPAAEAAPPGEDQQPYRKRTYSETDIGNRRTRKRYKTGDFDLDAQIASLPICHIDEVTRRGTRSKSLKIRHHSENSTLNKFAKPADINLLNVAELRGVLRPRSQSMSHAIVGSARRKAPKMSIVRCIQATRNPKASVVPLLSPKSASFIPPWSEAFPSKSSTEVNAKVVNSNCETVKTQSESKTESPTSEGNPEKMDIAEEMNKPAQHLSSTSTEQTDLQEAIGKVTCVNVTAVTEIRFEKSAEKTPSLVTCQ